VERRISACLGGRLVENPAVRFLLVSITSGSFSTCFRGQLQNHLRIFGGLRDAGHTRYAFAIGGRQYPSCQLHVSCALRVIFGEPIAASDRCLADTCGEFRRPPAWESTVNRHSPTLLNCTARAEELHLGGFVFGGPSSLSEGGYQDGEWLGCVPLPFVGPRWRPPGPYSVGSMSIEAKLVGSMSQCFAWRAIFSRWAPPAICRNPSGREYIRSGAPPLLGAAEQ